MPNPSDPRVRFDASAHLQEIVEKLRALPHEALEELHAARRADRRRWIPTVGPQRDAYESKADLLLFGGAGGGGKSDLGLGLAFTAHQRSIILRRHYVDLDSIIERAIEINGSSNGLNRSPPAKLRLDDGRMIIFGANATDADLAQWQGQAADLKVIDEAAQHTEFSVQWHAGWVRTTNARQRTRMVLTSNPPLGGQGAWLIGWFRPWLDPTHSNPAAPGELRWYFTSPDGDQIEITDEKEIGTDERGRRVIHKVGRDFLVLSRTFIASKLSDNPFLSHTAYAAQLDALPEPMRSALRDGRWDIARDDAEWQVIPTSWLEAAFARWTPTGGKDLQMSAMALDCAGGGSDVAVLAYRHGPWFAPLVTAQGKMTGDALTGFAQIMENRRDKCPVVLDTGGGYASGIKERLKDAGVDIYPFNGAHESRYRAGGSGLPCANARAEAALRFREALDPNDANGSEIALPPDPILKSDLLSLTWDPRAMEMRGVYQLVAKENLRKQLGRSPDRGDAVIMAYSAGAAAIRKAERAKITRPAFATIKDGPLNRFRQTSVEVNETPPWRK